MAGEIELTYSFCSQFSSNGTETKETAALAKHCHALLMNYDVENSEGLRLVQLYETGKQVLFVDDNTSLRAMLGTMEGQGKMGGYVR